MGGICGLIHFDGEPVCRDRLRSMTEASAYRGPDGIRYRVAGEAGLAHLAFHTTPESRREEQPLRSADGALTLVGDARLDNRRELLGILGAEPSATDADLLLAAFRRWRQRCPGRLLGDFAFAIWDAPRRELFCARDPLGVKPLHYARLGPWFCFASDAGQILQHPAVPRRLDELNLAVYLCGDLHVEADRTMFDCVRRLPPAHRLLAGPAGLRVERYWEIDPGRRTVYRRPGEYAAHFRELLERAVAARLRVPDAAIGISLSGGLDSTSVAALAHRALAGAGGSPRLVAASFVFDRLEECDERSYSGLLAEELGLEVEPIAAERFAALTDRRTRRPGLEMPPNGWEGCFRELCGRFRARGARVFLTGDGGDETAGGMLLRGRVWRRWWLREAGQILRRARRRGDSVPRTVYNYWLSRLLPGAVDQALRKRWGAGGESLPPWLGRDLARRIGLEEWFRWAADRWRSTAEQTLPHGLASLGRSRVLPWLEVSAAVHGAEPRYPFLDRRLVEFLFAIPLEQVVHVDDSKPLLRQAMARALPEPIRTRPDKTDLSGFLELALREKEAVIGRLLRAPRAAELGFVDPDRLRAAFRDYWAGEPGMDGQKLWYTVALELWLRSFSAGQRSQPRPDRRTDADSEEPS